MTITIRSRYYDLKTLEVDGRVSLGQRLTLPMEPPQPDAILHTIVGGETLDELAAKYYGREDLWWRIADANSPRFPLDWKPGDKVVVPPIRVATRVPRG